MELLESVTAATTVVEIPQAPTLLVSDSDGATVFVEQIPSTLVLFHGEQGPPGISPAGADKHYEHVQAIPASVWDVTHGLGKKPAVTVLDSAGEQCEGEVDYPSDNAVQITFTAPFSGVALFN